jgi:hypothetical protein
MADLAGKASMPWIIGLLTVAMTGFNGYTSYRIGDTKAEIEQQAQDLEAARARMERYGFVQKMFSDLVSTDSTKRTLTINLITLALSPEEAERLFAGFRNSTIAEVRAVGQAGAATLAQDQVAPIVAQLNAGSAQTRVDASKLLRAKYAASAEAISNVLNLYHESQIDQLSASGRINTLDYLASTDPTVWSPEQIQLAEDAIKRMEQRQRTGKWNMGGKTLGLVVKLRAHLKTMQNAQS